METVASFSIPYEQFINAEGKIVQDLPETISPAKLEAMYKLMTLLRIFDTKGIALQRTGKMGTYPAMLGQEAISAAIGECMRADDVFVPFYRDAGTLLQRGVGMEEIYAYWGGDERGACYKENAQDLPMSVPIASQCLLATGIATAIDYREEDRVVVVTCGDGATSQGDFYEAINVAGIWNLPIVFVINNNQWAISVPRSAQTKAVTLAQKAIAAGIPGVQCDGNDVAAVISTLNDAITRAREGQGATVIEAITYRLCDHTTADDAQRYRPAEEVEAAEKCEPLRRLRLLLAEHGWDDKKQQALVAECETQVDTAVKAYLANEPQPLSSIFAYHFANTPENLATQLAALEAEQNA